MQEPPLAGRRIHDGALVGAVDLRGTGLQHDLSLVWTIQILGAEDGLPAATDAAFRDAQVVIPVPFMDFRPFRDGAAVNRHAVVQQFLPVRRHLMDDNGAGAVEAVPQVGLSVLIPEGARILPMVNGLHAVEGFPRACRVRGGTHEQAFVRRAEIDIEPPVVVADAGRPRAPGIVFVRVPARQVESVIDLGDECPVDQIDRFQHLHAHEMEVRGDQVIAVADADGIGVGVIREQGRVQVTAVARVAPGNRREACFGLSSAGQDGQEDEG